jgi:hypothetical protein
MSENYNLSGVPVCFTSRFCSSTIKTELWAEGAKISFIANIAELIEPPGRFLAFLFLRLAGRPANRAMARIEPSTTKSSKAVSPVQVFS